MKPVLPYVHAYRDRHGHRRYYFRRKGFKKVALPGTPGSVEFMAAYTDAQKAIQAVPVGAGRHGAGSLGAAIRGYISSAAFVALAPTSKRVRRDILEGL